MHFLIQEIQAGKQAGRQTDRQTDRISYDQFI